MEESTGKKQEAFYFPRSALLVTVTVIKHPASEETKTGFVFSLPVFPTGRVSGG